MKKEGNVLAGLYTKKSYRQPILRVYGDIQNLTESSATMGSRRDTRGFNMDRRTH
jgi:hypothetical protein